MTSRGRPETVDEQLDDASMYYVQSITKVALRRGGSSGLGLFYLFYDSFARWKPFHPPTSASTIPTIFPFDFPSVVFRL